MPRFSAHIDYLFKERPLIERARVGDAAAFGKLFASHEPAVARVCRRMLGPGAAAEDAASEVFLRARRALDDFDATRPFRPWLLGIAGHYCIDQLRRRATETKLFEPRDFSSDGVADPSTTRAPARLARMIATSRP